MAHVLSIATASPQYSFQQTDIAESMVRALNLPPKDSSNLRKLYHQSDIHTRYSVMQNFDSLYTQPTSQQRNEIFKLEAPKLAITAAKKALDAWQRKPSEITHVISVSCTGMIAPGIEYYLIKELGLQPTTSRVGINFMGCFGAFNAISVATAIAKENPKNRVLVVCTELCSLHGQIDLSPDTLLANALFADGAAACIVGDKDPEEKHLFEIINRSSLIVPNTDHIMSWDVGNHGYFMKLSPRVPVLLKKHIVSFAQNLIEKKCSFEECHWAIHPGGKSIIQAIEKECGLIPSQTESSWETLRKYGNMSSATFLFVLEKSLQTRQKWTLGIGFGPGLSMEGILMRS